MAKKNKLIFKRLAGTNLRFFAQKVVDQLKGIFPWRSTIL
jgi:hypothetical protein